MLFDLALLALLLMILLALRRLANAAESLAKEGKKSRKFSRSLMEQMEDAAEGRQILAYRNLVEAAAREVFGNGQPGGSWSLTIRDNAHFPWEEKDLLVQLANSSRPEQHISLLVKLDPPEFLVNGPLEAFGFSPESAGSLARDEDGNLTFELASWFVGPFVERVFKAVQEHPLGFPEPVEAEEPAADEDAVPAAEGEVQPVNAS